MENTPLLQVDKKERTMLNRIQIFTRGCVRSIVVEKNLRKAVAKMGLAIEVEVSADPKVHKEEDIDATPSVKINDELRVDGDFTSVADFEEMLSEYLHWGHLDFTGRSQRNNVTNLRMPDLPEKIWHAGKVLFLNPQIFKI